MEGGETAFMGGEQGEGLGLFLATRTRRDRNSGRVKWLSSAGHVVMLDTVGNRTEEFYSTQYCLCLSTSMTGSGADAHPILWIDLPNSWSWYQI